MAEQQYVVTGHHHEGDVYRLTIARQEVMEVPMVGKKGAPILNGEGHVAMIKQAVTVSEEDFLFAAGDPSWKGKSAKQIAELQRGLVLETLRKRESEQAQAAQQQPSHKELPGIGDQL
jgi:hypothetical protein